MTTNSRHTILLVENNPGDANLPKEMISVDPELTFDIIHVGTMHKAVESLSHEKVDAVLLDLNLPDSQGPETLASVRAAARNTPVVVLAGNIDSALRRKLIDMGADEVLDKAGNANGLSGQLVLSIVAGWSAVHQRQIERLLDNAPDAIIVIDEGSVVRYVNEAALKLFGRARAFSIGELLGFSPKDVDPVEISIWNGKEMRICEIRVVPFDWRGRPAFLGGIRDLTELRKTQAEALEKERLAENRARLLRKLLEDIAILATKYGLTEMGNATAAALAASQSETLSEEALAGMVPSFDAAFRGYVEANKGLTIAKDSAEAAARAKATFLATMSHELRTPMNAVIGMTSLLEKTPLSTEQREFVETIRTSSMMLSSIINDVLDFSKINAGRMELIKEPIRLATVVERSISLLSSKAAAKKLQFNHAIDPEIPEFVITDAMRLQQVLVNLLTNAIKFTDTGFVELAVRKLPSLPGHTDLYIEFSIRDSGIGIPTNRLDHLFTAFTQVDNSITREFAGTGLGLAISKELVELLGGRISVVSTLGKGSTFTFTITTQIVAAAAIPAARKLSMQTGGRRGSATLTAPDTGMALRLPLRILIAEDNLVNQRVLRLWLKRFGYEADVVENGVRAVEAASTNSYDMIFMDVQMPQLDGLAATQQLRLKETGAHRTYIVALTAGATVEERDACLAAGMDQFMGKPFHEGQLLDALERCGARRKQAQEQTAVASP